MRKIFLFEISNLKFAILFMILPFSSSPFPPFPPVKSPESGCIIPAPPDRRQTISANSPNPSRTLSGFADNMRKIFLFEISNLNFAIPLYDFAFFPPLCSLCFLLLNPLKAVAPSSNIRSPRTTIRDHVSRSGRLLLGNLTCGGLGKPINYQL
jgi:hypothetical protein